MIKIKKLNLIILLLNSFMSYYSNLSDDLDYVHIFKEDVTKEDKFVQTRNEEKKEEKEETYNNIIVNNFNNWTYNKYVKSHKILKNSKIELIFKILFNTSFLITFSLSMLLIISILNDFIKIDRYIIYILLLVFTVLSFISGIIYLIILYFNHIRNI